MLLSNKARNLLFAEISKIWHPFFVKFSKNLLGRRKLFFMQGQSLWKKRLAISLTVLFVVFILLILLFSFLLGPFRFLFFSTPSMAGVWKEKTYLVLLHNEGELRPTLGFITGFAIVRMNGGFPDIEFYDSYDVATPSEKVLAPSPIEEIFSKTPKYNGWEFRDSNFALSFEENVRVAKEFLRQDSRFSDIDFNGVIGMNTHVIESFLSLTGSITVDGKNFSSENFFEITELASKNFDHRNKEEWQERKLFLKPLAQTMMKKIASSPLKWGKFFDTVKQEADTKNMLFWFGDDDVFQEFRERGWTGDIAPDAINNLWAVNVANIGGRKGDRYIRKEYDSSIFVNANGKLEETFWMTFTHHGTRTLYSDEYTAFVRIVRPQGMIFTKSSGEFDSLPKQTNDGEVSFLFSLSPGERKTVSFSFELPKPFTEANPLKIFVFPQSGLGENEWNFALRGEGDLSFSGEGCSTSKRKENIFFCDVLTNSDRTLVFTRHLDMIPPVLESVIFVDDRTMKIFFSEKISPDIRSAGQISFTPLEEDAPSMSASSAFVEGKTLTIRFAEPVSFAKKYFYTLKIYGLKDLFGNVSDPNPFQTTIATERE
jgi:hypothetical protein